MNLKVINEFGISSQTHFVIWGFIERVRSFDNRISCGLSGVKSLIKGGFCLVLRELFTRPDLIKIFFGLSKVFELKLKRTTMVSHDHLCQ